MSRSLICQSPRRISGVTMIEVMLVLVMIAILTAVALNRLDFTKYRADSIGRGVLAELAAAQRVAVSLQSNVVITFPDSGRMQILEDANDDGVFGNGERVRIVPLEHNFYFGKSTAPDLPAPSDPTLLTSITFRRDGSANANGAIYIAGPGDDAACRHCRGLGLARATGRATFYSYATGAWIALN